MLGYYKGGAATFKVLDAQGWFSTGDLGFLNPGSGDLVLTGARFVGISIGAVGGGRSSGHLSYVLY